jgi:hypothetical protein
MNSATSNLRNKHLILDQAKLKQAQKVLGAKTETETIQRALEQVLNEDERNRRAWAAHKRFLTAAVGGAYIIHDVFGRVEDR